MLSFLMVQEGKPIKQEVAAADIKRGAPIENGEFLVDAPKNYDGINAVIDPREADCDTVETGNRYNKIPTRVGERYATTELTIGAMTSASETAPAYVKVSGGKFVAAATNDVVNWKYTGTYSNPYGLTMYKVEKIPTVTVSA